MLFKNKTKNIKNLCLTINFLINFKFLFNNTLFKNYIDFLNILADKKTPFDIILKSYMLFFASLDDEKNLSKEIKKEIIKNFKYENCKNQIQDEIEILKDILSINFNDIKKILEKNYPKYKNIIQKMPEYYNDEFYLDFDELDTKNNNDIFKNVNTFLFNNNLELEEIYSDEKLCFKNLKGYKRQKKILYDNTLGLINNQKVNNILLYGDAGCGKSSSIRALLGEFKDLKIIQIFKNNLINLDKLYLKLQNLPYKFVIFADDISYEEDDKDLSTMKAILEGSIIQCPKNAVIYATSNRRHLVKESFQARKGDEIHLNDTLNEINSLSERFGINLFFPKPNQEEFQNIVLELAFDNDIKLSKEELLSKANKLALIKGSKSPRVARQLIDSILSNVEIV